MQNLALPTKPANSPAKRENSSVKQALADRLLLSESLDAVSKMLRGFPNRSAADKSYLGAMAELLMQYPRSVALRCADPINGVARETSYLPTTKDIVVWCEKAEAPMHQTAAREDRVAAQLKAREEWENETKDPALLAKCKAWLDRTDPIAAQVAGTVETAEAKAERERRQAAEFTRRTQQISNEWGGDAPKIAGVPISKELAGKLGVNHDRNAQSAAAAPGP